MKQYLDICRRALAQGTVKTNRTGNPTIGYHGDMMKFDMADGFPAVTTKKLAFKACVGEMLGFLRGYDNAAQFRALGSRVWDANANDPGKPGFPNAWLNNPNRKGTDDLGRIYGVQARRWYQYEPVTEGGSLIDVKLNCIDQLKNVVEDLKAGRDNRREIVTHWNPAEMDEMALPPCHLLYQFGLRGDGETLDLTCISAAATCRLGCRSMWRAIHGCYMSLPGLRTKSLGCLPGWGMIFTYTAIRSR